MLLYPFRPPPPTLQPHKTYNTHIAYPIAYPIALRHWIWWKRYIDSIMCFLNMLLNKYVCWRGVLQFQSATTVVSQTLWHNCILIDASHYCGVFLSDSLNFEHAEWMRSALEPLNPLTYLKQIDLLWNSFQSIELHWNTTKSFEIHGHPLKSMNIPKKYTKYKRTLTIHSHKSYNVNTHRHTILNNYTLTINIQYQ